MKKFTLIYTLLIVAIPAIFTSSCCSAKKSHKSENADQVQLPGPKVIIYKTTSDYSQHVPVMLSDDKKSIASYPDIKDVFLNGELSYPTRLHSGYLLDNRGIDQHVAFLKLTYEEYSKLAKTPSASELMVLILDKDPLICLYTCGNKSTYKNLEEELNTIIDKGDFSSFVKIK